MLIACAIIFYSTPAWADGGAGIGPFTTLDATDSHGIKLSQYQLSVPDNLIMPDPITHLVRMSWSNYTIWVGLVAHLLDWTMAMTWVTTITGPLSKAQTAIRDGVLAPIGGTGLVEGGLLVVMGTIAFAVCGWHVIRGRPSGWWGMLVSSACAALAVGLFVAPVASIAGNDVEVAKPLLYAQRIGAELSSQMLTGKTTGQKIDAAADVGVEVEPVAASLVDVFIRPAHQALNYGVSIDAKKPGCVDAYDAALKAGPDPKPDAGPQRVAVGKCAGELQEYAENVNTNWLPFSGIFWLPALLATAVFLIVMILLWLSILNLAWTAFWLNIHLIIAVAPGDTRGPLIRDLVTIGKELIYISVQTAVLALALLFVRATLGAPTGDPVQRFLTGSLLMVAMLILVIANYLTHVRTGRSIAKRLTERAGQTIRDTFTKKATDWAAAPAPGTTSAGRGLTKPRIAGHHEHTPQALAASHNDAGTAVGGSQNPAQPGTKPMPRRRIGDQPNHGTSEEDNAQQGSGPQGSGSANTPAPSSTETAGQITPPAAEDGSRPGIKDKISNAAADTRVGQGWQGAKDSNVAHTLGRGNTAAKASASRFRMLRAGATRATSGHPGVDRTFDAVTTSSQKMTARVENARDRLRTKTTSTGPTIGQQPTHADPGQGEPSTTPTAGQPLTKPRHDRPTPPSASSSPASGAEPSSRSNRGLTPPVDTPPVSRPPDPAVAPTRRPLPKPSPGPKHATPRKRPNPASPKLATPPRESTPASTQPPAPPRPAPAPAPDRSSSDTASPGPARPMSKFRRSKAAS